MHDPEPQFEELPDALVARLERADRSQAIIDPRTDRAVVDDARRYFLAARPRRARSAGDALGAAARRGRRSARRRARAAAFRLPALGGRCRWLGPRRHPRRVRARALAGRSRERRCARRADRLARPRNGAICEDSLPGPRFDRRRRARRELRASSRSSGARRASRWSTCTSTPRCRSPRGSSSCTSGTARCRSWESRTATAGAYPEAPYYDRAAVDRGAADRIIVASFSLSPAAELPVGRARVATVHVRLTGAAAPDYQLQLVAAGAADGRPIDAKITLDTRTGR